MTDLLSYARLFLGFSPPIASLILKYAGKASSSEALPIILPITLLSLLQVNRALQHPHNRYLKSIIKVQSSRVKTDRDMIRLREEIDLRRAFLKQSLNILTQKKGRGPKEMQQDIEAAIQTLEREYKQLNAVEGQLKENVDKLHNFDEHFGDMAKEFDQEWVHYREQMLGELLNDFERLK